jgi:hypothetical protein
MKLPLKSFEIPSLCGQFASYLKTSLPDLSCDSDPTRSKEEVAAAGQAYFDLQYGDTAAEIQPMLRSIYPDLGMFPKRSDPELAPEFDHQNTSR